MGKELLFYKHGEPAARVGAALRLLARTTGMDLPCYEAHALRRGTSSILKKLGLSVDDLNLHIGWAVGGKTW